MAKVVGLKDTEYLEWNGRIVEVLSNADENGIVDVAFDGSEAAHFDWFDLTVSFWLPRKASIRTHNLESWPPVGSIDPFTCRFCSLSRQLIPEPPASAPTRLISGQPRAMICPPSIVDDNNQIVACPSVATG